MTLLVLVARVSGHRVAIRADAVRAVVEIGEIAPVPRAQPHVAGLAALHAEANPGTRGGALGWLLLQAAQRMTAPSRDVGAGLAQAPAP